MEHNIKEIREESIAELKAALEELESGEGLSRFVGGHGLMSRMFEFSWSEPTLEIDFRLPYARVLMDEESQKADEAGISMAIRMAILLLTVEGQKPESPEELSLNVWSNEDGTGYALHDEEGNETDSDDDWTGLVHRLDAALPHKDETQTIIWP